MAFPFICSSDSPGSSSSSEWSPVSPLPAIEGHAEHIVSEGPDRLMGPPVNARLPRLSTAVPVSGALRRPSLRLGKQTHP